MMHDDIMVWIVNNTGARASADDQHGGIIGGAVFQAMGNWRTGTPAGGIARPKHGLSILDEDKFAR